MKEVLLDEKLCDKARKGLFVCAEKSSLLIQNCEHETSCTFVEEIEEGTLIAEGLNMLSGFVETVSIVEKRSCRLRRISQKRSRTLRSASL